jgi:hypothetical protein
VVGVDIVLVSEGDANVEEKMDPLSEVKVEVIDEILLLTC